MSRGRTKARATTVEPKGEAEGDAMLPAASNIPQLPRLLLTVEDAAHVLCMSRVQCYRLVSSGELKSVKIGRLRRVPVAEIERFIHELSGDAA